MDKKQIGEEIRRLATEIERLDPNTAPVFVGFSQPNPPNGQVYGMFQAGSVPGYDASLAHVRYLLAEVRQRIGQRVVHVSPEAERIDRHRRQIEESSPSAMWGRYGGMDHGW